MIGLNIDEKFIEAKLKQRSSTQSIYDSIEDNALKLKGG